VSAAAGGRRIRVATMIDRLAPSGAELFASRLAARLDPARFESILCVTRPSDFDVAELESAGVRLLYLDRRSRIDVWRWAPLVSLLRRERVDVLHSHKFGSNVWAALLAPLARTPVLVAHEHTWSYEGQPLRRFLDRRLVAPRADVVVTVSREDRRRMIAIERVDPAKVTFVASGVVARPPSGRRDVRAELGIGADTPLVGAVCGLRPQKALDVLVRAAALLEREVPGVRVAVVGEGPERSRLERLVAELGLGDSVALLGPWHPGDVPDFVAALDVAVSSSDFEGTPLAVMEYMAAGTPVVATAVGGVPDLIDRGVHGLLVPPRDPEALSGAIAELLHDRERARELGRRAQERQRREFDFDVTVRRIEELYVSLVGSARTRSS
jgi:glycosyltransferase involved in cell wall biosynthesis